MAFQQLLNTRLVSAQLGSSALGSKKHLIRPYPEPLKSIYVHTSRSAVITSALLMFMSDEFSGRHEVECTDMFLVHPSSLLRQELV
jgi:hypothetical protein